MGEMIEVQRRVPVVADVDVLVAGGGIAGATAAVTAGREGAHVMLVERFGTLGGNMGPGMFSGGSMPYAHGHPHVMPEGLKGIPGEFINRAEGYADGELGHDYFRDSQVVSYVWLKMAEENNVRLLLNTHVGDPILEGNHVAGLLVENKSGMQAIRAKVVIDATGDADVVARACLLGQTSAAVDEGEGYSHPGMYFAIGGVDVEKYQNFLANAPAPSPEDVRWAEEMFTKEFGLRWYVRSLNPLIPFLKRSVYMGQYNIVRRIGDLAVITVDHGFYPPRHGLVGAQVGLWGPKIHSGDAAMWTQLEVGARLYIFDTVQFLRRHVPGFERAYLHMISPYFHARGGRSAVCDYCMSQEDVMRGARFDDVVFLVYGSEREQEAPGSSDFPYRQFLPRGLEGILTAGRSTIIQPPTMRTRWKVFLMGQVVGLAAAIAARDGLTPRQIDVKKLQRLLVHKYHIPLGPPERLRELGLA